MIGGFLAGKPVPDSRADQVPINCRMLFSGILHCTIDQIIEPASAITHLPYDGQGQSSTMKPTEEQGEAPERSPEEIELLLKSPWWLDVSRREIAIVLAAIVGWIICWPMLFVACDTLISALGLPDWLNVSLFIIGILAWFFWVLLCYVIYDTLFTMAEARWPAAKGIREIVSPLLKAFLLPHHHSK